MLTATVQQNYFGNIKARAGQPHLNAEQVLNTPILLPPKTLQEKFSVFVKSLRNLRLQRNESALLLNKLFANMLHRAFTCELTAKWREAHMKELIAEMERQARLLNATGKTN